jgi:hypothetical protein
MPKPHPPEFVDLVRCLASEGKTSSEIGAIVGKTATAIQDMYRKHKIACRPGGSQPGNTNAKSYQIDVELAKSMYLAGSTHAEIAVHLGLSQKNGSEVVRRRLLLAGVQSRTGCAKKDRNYFWKGGRDKYSSDHRDRYQTYRVVVAFLGMLLPKGWVVHHLDEDATNDSLSNLVLFPNALVHSNYHLWLIQNQLLGNSAEAIQEALRIGGHRLLQSEDQTPIRPDKALLSLLEMECERLGVRTKWKHLADAKYQPRISIPIAFPAQCNHDQPQGQ